MKPSTAPFFIFVTAVPTFVLISFHLFAIFSPRCCVALSRLLHADFTAFAAAFAPSLNAFVMLSQFLTRRTMAATTAAMMTMIARSGGPTDAIAGMTVAVRTVPSFVTMAVMPPAPERSGRIAPTTLMICPTDEMSVPMMTRRGPMAAITSPTFAMNCLCASDRLLNQSTAFWIPSAIFEIVGARASPRDVAATSIEDFSFSIDPPKPDIISLAIFAVVPSTPSASDNCATSAGAVLISASQLAIWFFPKIADAAAICSDSESVWNA